MSKLNADAQPFEPAAAATSKLNADAQPFTVGTTGVEQQHADKDEKSLFMTFSTGSPPTKKEIEQYFTRSFGQCVEYVYLQRRPKKDPEFGKITFITPNFPEMIMLNRQVVKICVNHKPIWLKKYVPRSQRKLMAETS